MAWPSSRLEERESVSDLVLLVGYLEREIEREREARGPLSVLGRLVAQAGRNGASFQDVVAQPKVHLARGPARARLLLQALRRVFWEVGCGIVVGGGLVARGHEPCEGEEAEEDEEDRQGQMLAACHFGWFR